MTTRGAYDFETYEWTKALCIGLRWGKKGWSFFRHPTNPKAVVEFTLRSMLALAQEGDVKEWWAHNGGNFDGPILLQHAADLGFQVDVATNGAGRALLMKFTKDGVSFTLKDSFCIVATRLQKAAEDFELPAGKLFSDADYKSDMRKAPLQHLKEGCRRDCELVLQLLEKVDGLLRDMGGSLRSTAASSALSVLRSKTSLPKISPEVNHLAENALYGGRVEVFHHDPVVTLTEYDVNSSYPWSMSQPLPGEFDEDVKWVGDWHNEVLNPDRLGVTLADVVVPESHVPCLPYRDGKGGLYFPSGAWRAWFPNIILQYAAAHGGAAFTAIRTLFYKPLEGTKEFISDLYHVKSSSLGARREMAKLMLNSCYGKFGESPEKDKLLVVPDATEAHRILMLAKKAGVKVDVLGDARFQLHPFTKWPRQTNYATAAYITARSQILLHQHLTKVDPKFLAYCDTDSIHAPRTKALDDVCSDALGDLKVELPSMLGRYYAPKVYELFDTVKKQHWVACKGFTPGGMTDAKEEVKEEKRVLADFQKMIQGEPLFRERMRKVKTQLRAGNVPAMVSGHRSWSGKSVKRFPYQDGSTRPWRVDELEEGKHLHAWSPLFKGEKDKKRKR